MRIWNFRLDSHCSWRCERNNIFSEAGNKQTFYRIRTETFPNNWSRVIHFDRHCYSVSVCAFRYLSKFPEYLLSFLFSIEICIIRFVYFSHRASFQIKFYLKWNARMFSFFENMRKKINRCEWYLLWQETFFCIIWHAFMIILIIVVSRITKIYPNFMFNHHRFESSFNLLSANLLNSSVHLVYLSRR